MILTYQYRLLPSKRQHRALEILLEAQRVLYNAALEERIGAYRHRVALTYIDQCKSLSEWRQRDPEAASFPLAVQRATLKRLDEAYKAFFRRVRQKASKPGFPRFRGKGWWDSFGFREFEGITFDGSQLRFKGMPAALNVHVHRPMPVDTWIRSCVFRRDAKGWKVGFAVEVAEAPVKRGGPVVGIDPGISTFAALSDGGIVPSFRSARRAHRRIRVLHRALTRKHRGSKNRAKARNSLRRCHAAATNARSNHLHQASARLTRGYDAIAIEALNVRSLARTPLARDVYDASWARFILMILYKAARAGVRVIQVDPRNTSQECSGCGSTVDKELHERWHDCPGCGLSMDRDLNAARNILGRAGVGPCLPNVVGCDTRAGGNLDAGSRPELRHCPS